MTAEELDALAAEVGQHETHHNGCDLDCEGRQLLELARGYLSLRLVQADHERQITAIQAAFDDMQAAYLRVEGELTKSEKAIDELYEGSCGCI